jgi:hypothetical protein
MTVNFAHSAVCRRVLEHLAKAKRLPWLVIQSNLIEVKRSVGNDTIALAIMLDVLTKLSEVLVKRRRVVPKRRMASIRH